MYREPNVIPTSQLSLTTWCDMTYDCRDSPADCSIPNPARSHSAAVPQYLSNHSHLHHHFRQQHTVNPTAGCKRAWSDLILRRRTALTDLRCNYPWPHKDNQTDCYPVGSQRYPKLRRYRKQYPCNHPSNREKCSRAGLWA